MSSEADAGLSGLTSGFMRTHFGRSRVLMLQGHGLVAYPAPSDSASAERRERAALHFMSSWQISQALKLELVVEQGFGDSTGTSSWLSSSKKQETDERFSRALRNTRNRQAHRLEVASRPGGLWPRSRYLTHSPCRIILC